MLIEHYGADAAAATLLAYVQDHPRSGQPQWFDPNDNLDLWIDVLFAVDFLIYFRTAFFVSDGASTLGEDSVDKTELGADSVQILKYRVCGDEVNGAPSTAFCIGLATSVPWDRLFLNMPYLRLIKCIRVERMAVLMPFIEALLERAALVFPMIKPITEIVITAGVATALCHVMSCFLYFAGHPMWEVLDDGSGNTYACETGGTCGWVITTFSADESCWQRYWTAFVKYLTCSQHGLCSYSVLEPGQTYLADFAQSHDRNTWACFPGTLV